MPLPLVFRRIAQLELDESVVLAVFHVRRAPQNLERRFLAQD